MPYNQPQVVRLSCLLRAYPANHNASGFDCETFYWQSPEVKRLLTTVDSWGLCMVLLNMLCLLVATVDRPVSQGDKGLFFRCMVVIMMIVATGQLLLIRKHRDLYYLYRHPCVVVHRLVRIFLAMLPPIWSSKDVIKHWMPQTQNPAMQLFCHACLYPLIALQATCTFSLPTASALLLQVGQVAVGSKWVRNAPLTLHSVPGMQDLACSICNGVRGTWELMLYVLVDLAAMPGVPAAGVNAFGIPDPCSVDNYAVYTQLLLYANLLLSFMLPMYSSYVIELKHKTHFWKSKNVHVVVDRSPLMLLPEYPILSHAVVMIVSPLLLWFVAEQLNPFMQPGRAGR